VGVGDVDPAGFGATVAGRCNSSTSGGAVTFSTPPVPWVSKVWNHGGEAQETLPFNLDHPRRRLKHEETLGHQFPSPEPIWWFSGLTSPDGLRLHPRKGNRQAFIEHFAKACSRCRTPDRDLSRFRGPQNQGTTMLQERNGGNSAGCSSATMLATPMAPVALKRSTSSPSMLRSADATQENVRTPCSPWWTNRFDLIGESRFTTPRTPTHSRRIAISRASLLSIDTAEADRSLGQTRLSTLPLGGIVNPQVHPFRPPGPAFRVGHHSGGLHPPDRVGRRHPPF